MAEHILVIDTATGRTRSSGIPIEDAGGGSGAALPTVYDFDVTAPEGQTAFDIEGVNETQTLIVLVNGKEDREGALYNFTRDTVNGTIVFNYTVPQNAWVRVRKYAE